MDVRLSPTATAWERFASGDDAVEGVRPQILLSWKRCRDDYGVDPARDRAVAEPVPPPPGPEEAIVAAELGAAAMSLMGDVSAIGGMVAIADRHGRVLGAWGDPTALRRGREQNLDPMFIWREGTIGTTGIGTALENGAAIAVDRHEHWCSALQDWTCAAAGVRDPLGGAALGAIDISARERSLPPAALDALTRAVVAIEKRLRERSRRARGALADACRDHGGSPGVAVLDRGGRIVHAGDTARAALGTADPDLRRIARAVAERAVGDRGWIGTAELQNGKLATVEPVEDANRVIGVLVKLDAADGQPVLAGARPDGVLDDRVIGMLGRRMLVVPAERLRLAEVIDGRVWLDGDDGRLRAAARGLDELEARLTPHGFLRVNRHTLVNLRKVSELAPSFNRGLWVLVEGSDRHIPVSRRRVGALRTQLGL
jgi:DNA-binding LytR/AlgR family response regulator